MRLEYILAIAATCLLGSSSTADALQVTINPSKDNMLVEDASGALSNGAGDYFFAGVTGQVSDNVRRGLIAFDIAGNLPAGSTVNSVTLTLTMTRAATGGSAADMSLHAVTQDWGEGSSDAAGEEGSGAAAATGEATWLHTFFNSSTWATPGGDFAGAASATTNVANTLTTYSWTGGTMAADVQGWLDNPSSNFGWLLKADNEASRNAKRFNSRTNASGQPELLIDFEPPASVDNWILY